ncbi:MAG: aldehyde ferredoxin oxidoreductase family protein [Desulfovibrio sp.]
MKFLRINCSTRQYKFEEPGDYAGLGGRALTSRLILNEVPATCHPLSKENKLIAAAGTLTGTVAANSGRVSVGAKSPLTGTIKESNSGGQFAQRLARLGILAVILEDKPEDTSDFFSIHINKDGVTFEDSTPMAGKTTYKAMDDIIQKHGPKTAAMIIGPAGEKRLGSASIQFSDPEGHPARAAGRGGLGAVMGSKRVKAITLDDSGCKPIAAINSEDFKAANKKWVKLLLDHPVTGQGLPAYGSAVLVNIINEAGALPTKNFRDGRFEGASKISGEAVAEKITERNGKIKHGCHTGCVIQCSQEYRDKAGKYLTSGFEYETIWGFGANLLIDDIDIIAQLDRCCDELGLDTIEMANTVAMAMEGNVIPWGDGEGALELLKKVGTTDPMGNIIGNGTGFAAKAFGVDRVPVVKNQALPAYDPRVVKGVGVTYATTTMGADHTAGYGVCQNVLKCGGDINGLTNDGNVELSKNLQIATAAIDSLGLCLFVAFPILDDATGVPIIAEMVQALIGQPYTADDIINLGVKTLEDEIDFNNAAGFSPQDDQLPDFFINEELPTHGIRWDYTVEELQGAKVK